ncbi:transcriptional regulator, GntR family [Agromyces sp. CF514]|uniref:GntR family transcriptional regulator n=1 Tax=Agromyces sp. CF514 TaxID=1881031 RepID=UPI0008EA544D|nr:GntR family transcriptional regulator [Agromyces sp. CF514]SFR90671.1 transcriptional regulator, GntR family [Agromyces sp. CF514]
MSAQNAGPRGGTSASAPVGDGGAAALQQLAGQHATGYRSVGVMVYDILKDAILSGALLPGQKLRQETLAELIGVSRLPVRSALIQLEADGLVEFHDRRGAVVKSLSPSQAKEVYDIRVLLEVEALRLTMAELTDERVARLRALGKSADQKQEGAEFVDARTEFYAELYDAARRPVLWDMIEQLRLKVGRYVLGWRLVGDAEHSHTHEQLVEAVASGDADRAAGVLRDHLVGVRDAVLELLEAESQETDASAPALRVRAPR